MPDSLTTKASPSDMKGQHRWVPLRGGITICGNCCVVRLGYRYTNGKLWDGSKPRCFKPCEVDG